MIPTAETGDCLSCGAPAIPLVREVCPLCGGALTPVTQLSAPPVRVADPVTWLDILDDARAQFELDPAFAPDANPLDRFLLALCLAWDTCEAAP